AVGATDSFTFTVSDGAGGAIGATTFTFSVSPFAPPPPLPPALPSSPLPLPPGSGPGPGSTSGSAPGLIASGGAPLVLQPPPILQPAPVLQLPQVSVQVDGRIDEAVKNVAMPSRMFARAEQPDVVLQEMRPVWMEPLALPVKKMLAIGHKLAESLDRLAHNLDRAIEEREQKAHWIGRVASFSGIVLSAGFAAWLLRGGALIASFLVSMPAWRHFDPLPVLGAKDRDRQKRDREAHEDYERENEQFRGLDRVLKASTRPVKQQEKGRIQGPRS
ncbi:MAG: cadherin-like domain-containing protein, partial [Nitrospira sp.]|nr:cadherin-like domain-containing protein [Nitrospira sp.]